jgi:Uncharacterized protein conserved in bacteria
MSDAFVRQRYDYHVWANDRLLDRLEELPEAVWHAGLQSVFPSISECFAHIYQFDRLWLSVLKGIPNADIFPRLPAWREEALGRSLKEMRDLFAAAAGEFRSWLEGQADLTRPLTIEHPRFGTLETRYADIVEHVVNHGTYHRGNIAAMIRQQGHAGTSTDYVFYLMEKGRS